MSKISLSEIPIFCYLEPADTSLLSQIFKTRTYKRGETILEFGSKVENFFIVTEGTVEVYTANFSSLLTSLQRGSSFGEMSFVENETYSSASLLAASDKVEVFQCTYSDFSDFLQKKPKAERGFYKACSAILSRRLRTTNQQIVDHISKAHTILSKLMKESNVVAHLQTTKSKVDRTGGTLIGGMQNIIPIIEKLHSNHPEWNEELKDVQKNIEAILLEEAHSFDRIAQQLDIIRQHFTNIEQVLRGEKKSKIKGDQNIF